MAAGFADCLYQAATIIAILIVMWDSVSFFDGLIQGDPIIRISALLLAGVIWLIGRGCRYVLAGR